MKSVFAYLIVWVVFMGNDLLAQSYFIDGFHGGVYGHYPKNFTSFILKTMQQNPDWKINLEIEPETWDSALVREPKAYLKIKSEYASQSPANSRIEFVNPAYGQSYLFNISGESIIRQFDYGIKKIKEHFPGASFLTYSSEEPCFTSALPGILKSFGYKYASLKNPNTCWGGYTSAYGGEVLNWVGPNGDKIITVPRYESEELEKISTWQTDAWTNSDKYISAARNIGVKSPIGMCLQDAGWRNGPWLGNNAKETKYITWADYFQNIISKPSLDWKVSQEDILVSLVWGSQKLQQIAQMVRAVENKLIIAEKLNALSGIHKGSHKIDSLYYEAWRNLLLAQHHDCWIVPLSWHNRVVNWINKSNFLADQIIAEAKNRLVDKNDLKKVIIINTSGVKRSELVSVVLPTTLFKKTFSVFNEQKKLPQQINYTKGKDSLELLFIAEVPPTAIAVYSLKEKDKIDQNKGKPVELKEGFYRLENDIYKIQINPKTGVIESLITKADNKEYISVNHRKKFNELSGYFYDQNKFLSSCDEQKTVSIVEDGNLRKKIKIKGKLGVHNIIQFITVINGQKRIDLETIIHWKKNEGIGDGYAQKFGYDAKDRKKAFYVDTAKLSLYFPANLTNAKLYKDAPFDVTESKLENTFFGRWDSIKNNIMYRWIDLYDKNKNQGIALFTDHTSSYSYGKYFPLALTVAYSGKGLWYGDYKLEDSTKISYSILPHKNNWQDAAINAEASFIAEPLIASAGSSHKIAKSIFDLSGSGFELTSLHISDRTLTARFYNARNNFKVKNIPIGVFCKKAQWIRLNEDKEEDATIVNNKLQIALPPFGFKTLQVEL